MLSRYEFIWKFVYISAVILIASCEYSKKVQQDSPSQLGVQIDHEHSNSTVPQEQIAQDL